MNGKELKEYLKNHYDKEAAAIMGCSLSMIYEFRKHLGMPNYKTARRLQLSKQTKELRAQGKTLKEIREIVGFKTNASVYYYLNYTEREGE